MHLQVFYERKQSLYNWSSNWYTSSFSLKAKQTKAKKKCLEVGRAKIVTHLQVGVTDLCLELLVTITDSIKLSVISKPGILNKQKRRLSLGWPVELLQLHNTSRVLFRR